MNRIGLFGGSFDPVHLGHLLVAQAACEEFNLDRLFFVPAAQSPLKPERIPAPPEVRLRMLRLALVGEPNYEVDDQEIRRGGPSYTIDTVRAYRQLYPKASLFYIIGADHVPLLPKWRAADELAALVEFLVVPRPGDPPVAAKAPFRVQNLVGTPFAVSSSQIRTRVKSGKRIQDLVPAAVAEAIRNSGLYL
ncbi:MAG TPA: nicotinate-nucleotide adenylyltransferase [Verrucomicrobiae bacterium]|nr:nicotinate-nucleotide adenylyltransferase [Verrucomicrobiae bacterium]